MPRPGHAARAERQHDHRLIPYLPGVGLNAKLMAEGTDIDYEVGTSYTAPNGISLGAEYSSVDGASIHGGLKVSF